MNSVSSDLRQEALIMTNPSSVLEGSQWMLGSSCSKLRISAKAESGSFFPVLKCNTGSSDPGVITISASDWNLGLSFL